MSNLWIKVLISALKKIASFLGLPVIVASQHESHFKDMIPISEFEKRHLNLNRWPRMDNLSTDQKSVLESTLMMATRDEEEITQFAERMFDEFKEGFLKTFEIMKQDFTNNFKELLAKSKEIAGEFLGNVHYRELTSVVQAAKANPFGKEEDLNRIFNKLIPLSDIKKTVVRKQLLQKRKIIAAAREF